MRLRHSQLELLSPGGERETVELLGINVAQGAHETLDALVARGECELIDRILIDRLRVAPQADLLFDPFAVRCGSFAERAKLNVVVLLEPSVAGGRGGGGVCVTAVSEPVVTMGEFAEADFSDSNIA